jgi:hypothetical protein
MMEPVVSLPLRPRSPLPLTRLGPHSCRQEMKLCVHDAPFARWCPLAATARRELAVVAAVETVNGVAVSAAASPMGRLCRSAAAPRAGALRVPNYSLCRPARPADRARA